MAFPSTYRFRLAILLTPLLLSGCGPNETEPLATGGTLSVGGDPGAGGRVDNVGAEGGQGGTGTAGGAPSTGGVSAGGTGSGGRPTGGSGGQSVGGGGSGGSTPNEMPPSGGGSGAETSGGTGGNGAGSASGGVAGSGGAPPEPGPLFPAKGSIGQCPDPSIRLRFDAPPSLGASGSVRVYDVSSPSAPVARVDLQASTIQDTVGGATFTLPRPAYVDGNDAIFLLPSAGLAYGHRYFVTVEEGVLRDPEGAGVVITEQDEWTFTVADAPPVDRQNLSVALDGTGDFCSLQGAIDAVTSEGGTITLAPGAYYGIVYFKGKDQLRLLGADRYGTRILGVNNNNLNPSTRGRALFGTEGISGLIIENLTIWNQTPQDGSQAEALALLSCDQCIVRNATIRSLQDTLLWSGRIYAEDSLIEGNVDYIWGTGAVYFNRVEIKTVGRKGYNVQARNDSSHFGYVFVDSKLSAEPGITGDVLARIDVSAYPSSHVAYIDCEMGPHISREGWLITGGGSVSNLRFWEYQSTAPGGALLDVSGRVAGSRQLSASEAAEMRDASVVLDGWDPR